MPGATTRRSRSARRGSCRRRSSSRRRRGCIGYNDIDPRIGVAYDLFGNGKTALKFNAGRYLEAAVGGNGNYSSLLPSFAHRHQRDADVDRRQRQLHARLRSGEWLGAGSADERRRLLRRVQQSELREERLQRCRTTSRSSRAGATGRSDWIIGATVQHELLPRVSVGGRLHAALAPELHGHRQPRHDRGRLHAVQRHGAARSAAAGRRRLRGLRAVQRRARRSSAPADNYRTYAPDYGNISQMYNGIDINVAARLRNGLQLQAGSSTGQRVTDYCEVRAKLPEQTRRRSRPAASSRRSVRRTPTATTRRGSTRGSPAPARTRSRRSTCCSAAR